MDNEKNAQRCKHCALAVVRRSQKNFAPPQTPCRGRGTAKIYQLEMATTFTYIPNLLRIDERNFEFTRDNRPTRLPACPPHTGAITIHCAAAIAQCNNEIR